MGQSQFGFIAMTTRVQPIFLALLGKPKTSQAKSSWARALTEKGKVMQLAPFGLS